MSTTSKHQDHTKIWLKVTIQLFRCWLANANVFTAVASPPKINFVSFGARGELSDSPKYVCVTDYFDTGCTTNGTIPIGIMGSGCLALIERRKLKGERMNTLARSALVGCYLILWRKICFLLTCSCLEWWTLLWCSLYIWYISSTKSSP